MTKKYNNCILKSALLLLLMCLSTCSVRKLQSNDWSDVIDNCQYGVKTLAGNRCLACKWGYRLDFQQSGCVSNVWYCENYSKKN